MFLESSSPLKSSIVKEFFSAKKELEKATKSKKLSLKETLEKQNYQTMSLTKRQSSTKTLRGNVIHEDCIQELSNFRKTLESNLTALAIQDQKTKFQEFSLNIQKENHKTPEVMKASILQISSSDTSRFQEITNRRATTNFSPATQINTLKRSSFIPTQANNTSPRHNNITLKINTLSQKINNLNNHKHTVSSFIPTSKDEKESISKLNIQKLLEVCWQKEHSLKSQVSKQSSCYQQKTSKSILKDSLKCAPQICTQKFNSNLFSTSSSINFKNNIEDIKKQIKQLDTKRFEEIEKVETASQSQANSLFQNANQQSYTLVTCRKRKYSQETQGNNTLPKIEEITKLNEAFRSAQPAQIKQISQNYSSELERLFETIKNVIKYIKTK